ncbi:MAG TPA: ABC transporter permease [Gemmatimonadaceae bacterium]|nr:ABC transporter permease [Gemmatimonadaceae bacterium]
MAALRGRGHAGGGHGHGAELGELTMRNPFTHPDGRRPFESAPRAEVGDELAFHLEERVRDYIARGMDPATARATALERFGDVSGVQRECTELLEDDRRAEARRDWLADLNQDVRFGIRSALRAKRFSLLAIITLALGIGANAAVFGVVKSVLLDALPYADAGQLVRVDSRFRKQSEEWRGALSGGQVQDVSERVRSFASGAAFSGTEDRVYTNENGARIVRMQWMQPGLLHTLGVTPILGRDFRDEDAQSDTAFSLLLSNEAWHRLFSADPKIVGQSIRIGSISRRVMGVLPPGFIGPDGAADIYFPLALAKILQDPVSARGSHWLGFVARRKPGMSFATTRGEIATLAADLSREHQRDDGPFELNVTSLRDAMVGDTRTPLLVLMASASIVLLITCANLAGALLSRTISRRKEFAVRVALGAGSGRLVRQLLTESTLLAVAGGVAGIALAMLGLTVLRHLSLPALPAYASLSLDPAAVVYTMALALITGLAFGIVPALSIGRTNMQATLRDETRGTSESRRSRRLRGALVAGQIALCVSLLAGAGLLTRSLWAMTTTPLGFDPDNLLTIDAQPPLGSKTTAELASYYEQLEERLREIPGVTAIATVSELPSASMNSNGLVIEGAPPPPNEAQPFVTFASVSDSYFRTFGIPLRSGRTFGPEDRPDQASSIVISQAMEKRFWPNGSALGARIRLGPDINAPWNVIVGVVGDVRNDPARTEPAAITYASRRQEPSGNVSIAIRAKGDALALSKIVQRTATSFDHDLALHNATTMRALLSTGLAGRRLPVMLMTAFGALALLLASVGVYAMFAAMAAAREREFGVRVALGSSRQRIAGLVLRQGATWMGIGLAGGVVGVVLVGSMLRNLLYGVQPFDAFTLLATLLMLFACASIALLGPVRRATQVDPISVMR